MPEGTEVRKDTNSRVQSVRERSTCKECGVEKISPAALYNGVCAECQHKPRATVATEGGFKQYRRKQTAELAAWQPGFDMTDISVSAEDAKAGSPKDGDMIARNPKNHADKWLVAAAYFADNFEGL